ncbi:MAG TPA: histone deacetylase [Candidatus Acidoferrales bacterium]|nr:histone deacetylase [Candidatus Acidoferrales bacterium]
MPPFKIVYHPDYDLHLGEHVFPSQKYRLIYEALLRDGVVREEDFLTPHPATDDDMLRVHTPAWVHALKSGHLTLQELMRLEIPWSREMVDAVWLATGGAILAGQRALADGYAANLAGGLHHAFPGHGEGFCAIHDVAVAIRRLQTDRAAPKAMVVDTDVHQGNGTAAIFSGDPDVFTLSIHQEHNYPFPKPASSIDINLADGTGDDDYLAILEKKLMDAFDEFHPDILYYIAGADPYREDQLGGLSLTIEGLKRRDRLVFEYARRLSVPVASVPAGGYARRTEDTVLIHVNTIVAAQEILGRFAAKV